MIGKILVPLDGSPLATCVFGHVIALAEATHAEIALISVLEKASDNGARTNPVDWQLRRVEVERYLDDMALHLSEFLETKPTTQVLEGSAAERIVEYAHKQEMDLIVLSSHGQGGLNGWNVSSVAQKVIQRASKSILLVPAYRLSPDCEPSALAGAAYRHILAPLDGSQRAETVLPLVTALAHQTEAQVHLVHVIARPEMMQRIPLSNEEAALADQLVERNQAQATHYLEQLRSRLAPDAQVKVILNGHVTASLHNVVAAEAVDLVVLSAHGYSGNDRWPYGSVVSSLITYAAVPLLILQDMPYHSIQANAAARFMRQERPFWRREEPLAVNTLAGKAEVWAEKPAVGKLENSLLTNLKKLVPLKIPNLRYRAEPTKSW